MRGIALTALVAATIAPADSAAAQTVHWSADIRVKRWVSEGGSEFFGYLRSVFGNIRGPPEFEYDGAPYTVRLFYITNEPRSLLGALEKWGSTANATLPADKGLAFMVDGVRFALSDVTRSPGEGAVAWDDSGLDWTNGQLLSVELVEAATPVPTLPLAGTVLLGLLLSIGGWLRRGSSATVEAGIPSANTARRLRMGMMAAGGRSSSRCVASTGLGRGWCGPGRRSQLWRSPAEGSSIRLSRWPCSRYRHTRQEAAHRFTDFSTLPGRVERTRHGCRPWVRFPRILSGDASIPPAHTRFPASARRTVLAVSSTRLSDWFHAKEENQMTLRIAIVVGSLLFVSLAEAAGIAICPGVDADGNHTGEYWVNTSSGNGYEAERELRRNLRPGVRVALCATDSGSGTWAVIDNNNRGGDLTLGYGTGSNREAAIRDAVRSLNGNDWLWSEQRDGYRLLNTGTF